MECMQFPNITSESPEVPLLNDRGYRAVSEYGGHNRDSVCMLHGVKIFVLPVKKRLLKTAITPSLVYQHTHDNL